MKEYFGEGGALSGVLERFQSRTGQLSMADAVMRVLGGGETLLVEAGTGTGKTLAYLIPTILSGSKVAISTGTKNLQEQIIEKDIPLLEKLFPGKFRAAIMKGRGNYLCKRRLKNFAQQPLFRDPAEGGLFLTIQQWAVETETGDRAEIEGMPDDYHPWGEINSKSELCLGQACPSFSSCFITRMRADAALADLVVVNHHLFFADLNVRENAFGEVIPRCDAVIFDEAHLVEETAMTYFGQSISNYKIAEAVRDADRELKAARISDADTITALASLTRRAQEFFDLLGRSADGRRRLHEADIKDTRKKADELLNSLRLVSDFTASVAKTADPIKALSNRFSDMAELLEETLSMDREDHVYWVETRGRGVFLQSSPIDVSGILKEKLHPAFESLVFTSATLAANRRFDFIKKRLGIEQAAELIIDSPFDYTKQTVFYVPNDLPDPSSEHFSDKAAERIGEILIETKGRAFVLFTSYRNMDKVYKSLEGKLPYTMLKQGDSPKSDLLKCFREDTGSVLFATMSFWQGVDVPGEALSAVIIDKLPFASPDDPLVSAIIESINKKGGSAFMEYQLPSAALLLKQGLGRLIRSEQDTGLLAVLDKRLFSKSYGRVFFRSLPRLHVSRVFDETKTGLRGLWEPQRGAENS